MFTVSDEKKRESDLSMLKNIQLRNDEYALTMSKRLYRLSVFFEKIFTCVINRNVKSIKNYFFDAYTRFIISKKIKSPPPYFKPTEYSDSDYFADYKIAVYTAVFGNYESIHEPDILPDNIDYFIFTDVEIPKQSRWKKRECEFLEGLSSAEKNRYVKMHPHLFFPEYEYSIYVDGSVQILSDLTPLTKRIGRLGFSMHMHSARNSVYDELKAAKITRRITDTSYDKCVDFFRLQGVPDNNGLAECGVIARSHMDSCCIKIMEEWWQAYKEIINRDQICLSYVLYTNKVNIDEINLLGSNIYNNPLFKILIHK